MAQDVMLRKNSEDIYDLIIENGDVKTVNGLETAIILSLFTDARANKNDVADAYRRRGWLGSLLTLPENYELGSVLWLLEQARLDQTALNDAERYAKRALAWLIDNGIADVIDITATKTDTRQGTLAIFLFKEKNEIARYITIWNATQSFSE